MKLFFPILFSALSWNNAYSQPLGSSADSSTIFARRVVDDLPEAELYFIGQLHNNAANTILERELVFSLNNRFAVSYDIIEYSHSVAVILNEYLLTGQDSLLSYISQEAGFRFIRSVKQFNDTVSQNRKIKFYGIDFEGRSAGRFTKKAISLILQQQTNKNIPLTDLLKLCEQSDSTTLPSNIRLLKKYLENNKDLSKAVLGNAYIDILLIANARYGFSPKRDKAMYQNFKLLYSELSKLLPGDPRFFGSFGIGHINPRNSMGIANILNSAEGSPVKNKVVTLGVQYLNCDFNQSETKPSEGIFNFLCKGNIIEPLINGTGNAKATFRYISNSSPVYNSCSDDIKKIKGIIIIENFKATANWMWE